MLLAYESINFASIGFSAETETLLVSVGTQKQGLAVAEAAIWTERLAKMGLQLEVQILKGRTKG